MPNEIFISYARENSGFVQSLVDELKTRGIDPWIDEEDIPLASDWRNTMLLGVQRCQDFLFILSPDSILSKPCQEELAEALRLNKRIIPGLIEPIPGERQDLIHPVLRSLNWIRFDKDRFKAIRQLNNLINSPKGWMGELIERPSAFIQILYYDGKSLDFPLIQDCYWIGRRPNPPAGVAGAIALPDPNPQQPITSRFHAELKVVNSRWYAFNRSKNDIDFYPRSPNGLLKDNMKIFVGHSCLIYREISYQEVSRLPEEAKETYTGEE